MKRTVLLVPALALLVGANAPGGGNAKDELKKLEGTWAPVDGELKGKPLPPELKEKIRITFSGDKISIQRQQGDVGHATFKLDPAKKPRHIDITPSDGPEAGKTVPGIYEVEGDRLKLAIAEGEGAARPAEFKAPEGSRVTYLLFERAKAGKGDKGDKSDK
jgi:uncharacterized protein (TIGR03067 family)